MKKAALEQLREVWRQRIVEYRASGQSARRGGQLIKSKNISSGIGFAAFLNRKTLPLPVSFPCL